MCLSRLVPRNKAKIPQFAYKVGVLQGQGVFETEIIGTRLAVGEWVEDKSTKKLNGRVTYKTGFHCFVNLKDAINGRFSRTETIVKVKLHRGRVTAVGVWAGFAPVVVCRRIKIVAVAVVDPHQTSPSKVCRWVDCYSEKELPPEL